MVPYRVYIDNLYLAYRIRKLEGAFVECGVWRGGMSAGIASILGKERRYYLFDSFEGLPEVKEIDGEGAQLWQKNKDSKDYFDNCKAEMAFAKEAFKKARVNNVELIKGWFNETLPNFEERDIALLRLDADWYDSTLLCLNVLFDQVKKGGMIIIDDYYAWDGCTIAVHEFLATRKLAYRIRTSSNGVCFIVK